MNSGIKMAIGIVLSALPTVLVVSDLFTGGIFFLWLFQIVFSALALYFTVVKGNTFYGKTGQGVNGPTPASEIKNGNWLYAGGIFLASCILFYFGIYTTF